MVYPRVYMKQIEIVETAKEKSAYNKKLKFLKKNYYDNQSAMNRTTNGNSFSRYKKDMNYWLLKIKEFEAVKYNIIKIQDELFKKFNDAENKRTECKVCQGAGVLYPDPEEYIECICQDDRWNPENQDVCLECNGNGCEYCKDGSV